MRLPRYTPAVLIGWGALTLVVGGYALLNPSSGTAFATKPVAVLPDVTPDKIWFDSGVNLNGWRARDGELRVWRTTVPPQPGQSPASASLRTGAASPAAIAVDRAANRAVWLEGSKLTASTLFAPSPRQVTDIGASPGSLLAIDEAGGSILLLDKLGSFRTYEAARFTPQREYSLPIKDATALQVHGAYIVAANLASGDAAVATLRAGELTLVERQSFGTALSTVAVAPGGRLIAGTLLGTLLGGVDASAAPPGIVRGLQPFEGGAFLLAGDFAGIVATQAEKGTATLVRGGGWASDIAWGNGHIAIASPRGVELHSVHSQRIATADVWAIARLWLMITGLAGASIFLGALYSRLIRGGGQGDESDEEDEAAELARLIAAGEDLKSAVSRRECVVVAGEQLSKLCGVPVWDAFLADAAESLRLERGLDAAELPALKAAIETGVEAGEPLLKLARQAYEKAAPISNVHRALGKVPLAAAISFNLDTVLERSLLVEDDEIFSTGDLGAARAALAAASPFLLKPRGVLSRPATVIVAPVPALAAFGAAPDSAELVTDLLQTRTLLFLGVPPKEIEAFVATAGLAKSPARKHYAILAGPGTLRTRSGVQVLPVLLSKQGRIAAFFEHIAGARTTSAAV